MNFRDFFTKFQIIICHLTLKRKIKIEMTKIGDKNLRTGSIE